MQSIQFESNYYGTNNVINCNANAAGQITCDAPYAKQGRVEYNCRSFHDGEQVACITGMFPNTVGLLPTDGTLDVLWCRGTREMNMPMRNKNGEYNWWRWKQNCIGNECGSRVDFQQAMKNNSRLS
jgi:hypothetical protein